MVADSRRRRRRPRPSSLVLTALVLCGLTLLAGAVLLAAAAAYPGGEGGPQLSAAPVASQHTAADVDRPHRASADRAALGDRRHRSAATAPAASRIGRSAADPLADPHADPLSGTPSGGPWVPPLGIGAEVLRGFEPPASEWGRGHRGVDLAAAEGDAVRATGPGVVSWAGKVAGRGVVTVTHDGGLRTTYEPVSTTVDVGRRVRAGDVLGTLEAGLGHCGGHDCLHWGLRNGRAYLDPLSLFRRGPAVLLPFWSLPPSTP